MRVGEVPVAIPERRLSGSVSLVSSGIAARRSGWERTLPSVAQLLRANADRARSKTHALEIVKFEFPRPATLGGTRKLRLEAPDSVRCASADVRKVHGDP
jgi:hypothetical protein